MLRCAMDVAYLVDELADAIKSLYTCQIGCHFDCIKVIRLLLNIDIFVKIFFVKMRATRQSLFHSP